MQPMLTVEGKQFDVYAVFYRKGKIDSVTIIDESGNQVSYYDINEDTQYYIEQSLKVDFATALKYPVFEEQMKVHENNLIEHLEMMLKEEHEGLIDIAINAMEEDVLPFVGAGLVEKQREYKLHQQRVLGIIDAVEEVKAYLEGFYAGDTNE